MPGTIAPFPKHQLLDSNGDPLAAALLFTYEAGTTTKLATYTDEDLSTPNANPIVLDSAGRATIFLSPTSYKFVLEPSVADGGTDPPTSPIWTVDEVSAVSPYFVELDVIGTAGETLTINNAVYLSDGSGAKTAGRWYQADADYIYSSSRAGSVGIVPAAIASGVEGSIRLGGRLTGIGGLTAGKVYYVSATAGAITATAPGNPRAVGVADTTTSLVLIPAAPAAIGGTTRHLGSVLTAVGNVGAGEDTLASITIPGGMVATNGDIIRGCFWGGCANNANAKTLSVRFIEGANDENILDVSLTANKAGQWIADFTVVRLSATTMSGYGHVLYGESNAADDVSAGAFSAGAFTWANSVEMRITGEATTNDDITITAGALTFTAAS